MNDRNDKQARLLAETFQGDWATGRPAQFARAAAAHTRRRRRLSQALATGSAVAAAAVVGFFVSHQPEAFPPATVAASPSLTPQRGYEIISDEQLLAQLRDRPVLVVQKENGSRDIVLLANE